MFLSFQHWKSKHCDSNFATEILISGCMQRHFVHIFNFVFNPKNLKVKNCVGVYDGIVSVSLTWTYLLIRSNYGFLQCYPSLLICSKDKACLTSGYNYILADIVLSVLSRMRHCKNSPWNLASSAFSGLLSLTVLFQEQQVVNNCVMAQGLMLVHLKPSPNTEY